MEMTSPARLDSLLFIAVNRNRYFLAITQETFTCLKSTMET